MIAKIDSSGEGPIHNSMSVTFSFSIRSGKSLEILTSLNSFKTLGLSSSKLTFYGSSMSVKSLDVN